MTGLSVISPPEWEYAAPSGDYRVKISVLGRRVVLSQPSGYASLDDVKAAVGLIERAVAHAVPPEAAYIEVEDYSRLKGVSLSGRKYFIDYLNGKKRLSALIFCGASHFFNMSIRLGLHVYPTDFPVRIFRNGADGLRAIREMLGDGSGQRIEKTPHWKSLPLSSEIHTRPEWHLRLDGFSVQYGVIGNRVIHGVSEGFLEESHIDPIIRGMETVYSAMGSPDGFCYCFNSVGAVQASTRKARILYYNRIKQWFSEHPGFRMYVFYGAGRALTAAILMTAAFAPFRVHTAKDFKTALELAERDLTAAAEGSVVSPESKNEKRKEYPLNRYVQELLQYLGSVDWKEENASADGTVNPSHPFHTVFDGIDLIKSELNELLRKQNLAERSLIREKQLSESIMDHIPAGIAFLDKELRLRKFNRSYARFIEIYTPYEPDQCLGMSYFDYVPGSREQVEEWYKRVMNTGMAETRKNFQLVIEKQGKQVATMWDKSVAPVRDDAGMVEGLLIMTMDTTDRIKAEEEAEALKEQLRQAQKMESIGTLAGGIAHDFNNILTAILGYTDIAIMKSELNPRLKQDLEEVLKAGKRARDLVKQILAFSRQSRPEMAPLKIEPVVREALQLIRASLPTTIDIRSVINSDAKLMGDATQIHQVVMNLCTNAGQAMKEGTGTLTVEVSDEELGPDFTTVWPGMMPGTYVRVAVSDTGPGIPKNLMERIFDPYFTTKEKGSGTGMGLAVVHGIVKNHGGVITVENKPGMGATFMLFLPTIKKESLPEKEITGPLPGGDEHILIVDDEKTLVEMEKEVMERLGYKVETRTSSIEALELFRRERDRFDLVITDMTMPNMTGAELAKKLMDIRSDIPIILCTGFSELITENQASALGISAFITKPVLNADLARSVRKVLDSSADPNAVSGHGKRPAAQ